MKCRVLGTALLVACGPALAQTSDLDALKLADTAVANVETPRDWQLFVEAAVGQIVATDGSGSEANNRWSANFQVNKALNDQFRFVVADRLDLTSKNDVTGHSTINTLKEAYVSWRVDNHQFVDMGRINQLYGVAIGYNPTDFFRAGAVRSIVSIDPNSLKENRLGSVMVRGQTLWDTGSLTALYSPRIEDQPSSAALDPDFGATNNRNRWLLALTQKVYRNFSPQVLLYGEEGRSVQAGVNLNAAPTDAIVTFFEWSGGHSKMQLAEAFNQPGPLGFHQRFASGLTYTTASKVSWTLEYEFDSAASSDTEWSALRQAPPNFYSQYRMTTQNFQDLATKQNVFGYVSWHDAMVKNLDLNAMLRFSVADSSCLAWVEARYHLNKIDLALQMQASSGSRRSEYAPSSYLYAWQALVRYYF
jgi:hypothetical protein